MGYSFTHYPLPTSPTPGFTVSVFSKSHSHCFGSGRKGKKRCNISPHRSGLPSHLKTSFPKQLCKTMSCSLQYLLWVHPTHLCFHWLGNCPFSILGSRQVWPPGTPLLSLSQASLLIPPPFAAGRLAPSTQPLVRLCWSVLWLSKRRFQLLLALSQFSTATH